MPEVYSIPERPHPQTSWVRRNIIDAAPLWLQLFRSAVTNVRISGVRSP
jgi:hypothetical protein